ncbi:hypothetical protein Dsin_032703 [Dipteronia sinensis]|uniref:Glycosyl hydrolase family 32 N-terminal domain-containing protein n=1 Tax=Dipteronia sinensis TaxID=43782 RepID=A0AAD9Z6P8_9ROSI|nr:hypothetical protein Dsin_032703 [Dipteronia sinensis]
MVVGRGKNTKKLPALDQVLGVENGSQFYMILGSGIRGVGPRIPLYTAPSNDLTNWTFQGALWEVPNNYSFGGNPDITGSHGYNYEMAGIVALPELAANGGDDTSLQWIVTVGAEGPASVNHPITHWSLFIMGTMGQRPNGSAEMSILASGVLDWGESYALNQFYDPVNDRQVIWGWVDEDLADQGVKAQGFQGSLGLPREIFVKVYNDVLAPEGGILQGAATWTPTTDGTYVVKTLGQRPLVDVVDAIQSDFISMGEMEISNTTLLEGVNSTTLHVNFTVIEVPAKGRFSVLLRASPDMEE